MLYVSFAEYSNIETVLKANQMIAISTIAFLKPVNAFIFLFKML